MSEVNEEEENSEKKVRSVKTAYDLQRLKLEKLLKQPEKPVFIPNAPKERKLPKPPEFIRNTWGSSAGAGSGDFHVYRGVRRREYARQKFLDEKEAKTTKDAAYQQKLEENAKAADQRTAKKRAKRLKKKQKSKQQKKTKSAQVESDSESEEDENETEEPSASANQDNTLTDQENPSAHPAPTDQDSPPADPAPPDQDSPPADPAPPDQDSPSGDQNSVPTDVERDTADEGIVLAGQDNATTEGAPTDPHSDNESKDADG